MKKNAFTLVETLVAIVIFGIWILTVLFGISKTLRNQDYASAQINSSFLAREWMELMFNLRDANYHKEQPRNCIFMVNNDLNEDINIDINNYNDEQYCSWYLKPWKILKIWIWTWEDYIRIETSELSESFEENFNKFQIYLHTWNADNTFIYNHTWTEAEKTRFARYMLITGVVEDWELVNTWNLLKIESHVLYKKWELTGEKVMETFMWNYEL